MPFSILDWLLVSIVSLAGGALFLFLQINRFSRSVSPVKARMRYEALYNAAATPLWVVDLSRLQSSILGIGIKDLDALEQFLENAPSQSLNLRRLFAVKEVNWASVELFGALDRASLLTHLNKHKSLSDIPVNNVNSRGVRDGVWNVDFEATFPDVNGEELHLWVNAALPLFQAGFDDVLVTLMDVSDRYRMQQKMAEREGFWEKVVFSVPDLVYVYDKGANGISYANRPMNALLGFPEGQMMASENQSWLEITHEEDKVLFKSALTESGRLRDGEVMETCVRMKGPCDWRWINFRNRVLDRGEDGEAVRFLGLARDITEEIASNARLEANERQYRLLAENMTDVVWTTDRNFEITYISPSVENVFGMPSSTMKGRKFYELFDKHNVLLLRKNIRNYLKSFKGHNKQSVLSKEVHRLEIETTLKQGQGVVLELNLSFLVDENARIQGIMGVCRDVTVRRRADNELRLAAGVFQSSTEAIVITDSAGDVVQVNNAFTAITGISAEQAIAKRFEKVVGIEKPSTVEDLWWQVKTHGFWQSEVSLLKPGGEAYPAWMGVTAIHDNQSQLVSHIAIFSDMTESKVNEEVINRLAFYDDLTGLANRALLMTELDAMVERGLRTSASFALLYLDLDRFKPVNDSLGHDAGDELLKVVSARIKQCVRDGDTVARMGGDEFTILIGGVNHPDKVRQVAANVAAKVIREIDAPFELYGRELFISASVGVAIYGEDGTQAKELLKNADTAMYYAKHKGRNNCQFYASDMNALAMERLELENGLRRAIDLGQLELVYQPQVDSSSEIPVGMEALIRWRHPERGLLSPDTFIPIAEESGLIVSIGEWVIKNACEQLVAWDCEGVDVKRIAVNLSARQLHDSRVEQYIASVLHDTGLAPERLEIEMTESMLMEDVSHVLGVLNRLKQLGVRISIDDFGTGYSSLSYLRQFPLDTLKIDKSFIQNLPGQTNDEQIVRAIIAIAHSLSLGVIAEGVENSSQRDFLAGLGCEEIQGFFFSKPLPPAVASQLFQRQTPVASELVAIH